MRRWVPPFLHSPSMFFTKDDIFYLVGEFEKETEYIFHIFCTLSLSHKQINVSLPSRGICQLKVKVKKSGSVMPDSLRPHDSSLHQAPPSMGFSRQEYWSGLPFPSPGNLPNPGILNLLGCATEKSAQPKR